MSEVPLINRSTGARVIVQSESGELEQRLASGQWRMADPSQNLSVLTPTESGSAVREVTQEQYERLRERFGADAPRLVTGNRELGAALSRQATGQIQAEHMRRLDQDFTGTAFVQGAASAASFGMSTVVQELLSPGSNQASALIAQANPTAHLLGTTAGTVLPSLVGAGPASLAGKGLTNIVRGTRAERAGAIARTALEGAVEGTQFAVADAMVQNEPLTAGKVFGGAGLGGTMGLTVGLAGAGIRSLGRWGTTTANNMINEARFARFQAQNARTMHGVEVGAAREARATLGTQLDQAVDGHASVFSRGIASQIDDIAEVQATYGSFDGIRKASGRALATADNRAARSTATAVGQRVQTAVLDAINNPGITRGLTALKEARGVASDATLAIFRGNTSAQRSFQTLHTLEEGMRRAANGAPKGSPAQLLLLKQADEAGAALRNADVFGDAARVIDASQDLNSVGVQLAKLEKELGVGSLTPKKLASMLREDPEKAGSIHSSLSRSLDEMGASLDKAQTAFKSGNPALNRASNRVRELQEELASSRATVQQRINLSREAPDIIPPPVVPEKTQLQQAMDAAFPFVAGVAGAVDPTAAVGMGLFSLMGRKSGNAVRIANLLKVGGEFTTRLDGAAKLFGKALRTGARITGGVAGATRRAAPLVIQDLHNRKTRLDTYRELVDQYQQLASSPDMMASRLGPVVESLETLSPGIAQEYALSAVNGVAYVASQIPATPVDPLIPTRTAITPSQTEMDNFINMVYGVEDPMSLYEDLVSGITTMEKARAVEAVHPVVYQAISESVFTTMADHVAEGGEVSYQTRTHISTVFGVEADATHNGQFISAMQSNFAQTPMQAATLGGTGQQNSPTPGTPPQRRMEFSSAQTTQSQRVENR